MDLGLKGKKCVVLGGSRGIGKAIALGLADEGADVAICARSEPDLRVTESALRTLGVDAFAQTCDLADAASLAAFLDAARQALGAVEELLVVDGHGAKSQTDIAPENRAMRGS